MKFRLSYSFAQSFGKLGSSQCWPAAFQGVHACLGFHTGFCRAYVFWIPAACAQQFLQALNLLATCFALSPSPLQLVVVSMCLVGISTDFISVMVPWWLPLSGLPWIPACLVCCPYLAWHQLLWHLPQACQLATSLKLQLRTLCPRYSLSW